MSPCRRRQCQSCIFREDGAALALRPGRLDEIRAYLATGRSHDCHTRAGRTCRGARDYQLMVFARLGLIAEPTDAALDAAMRAAGVDPGRPRD